MADTPRPGTPVAVQVPGGGTVTFYTSKPLCVTCSQLSGCFVVVRSLDKAVSLSLGWRERDFHRPQPTWSLYDVAARKIAQSIFIDRTPGDVQ